MSSDLVFGIIVGYALHIIVINLARLRVSLKERAARIERNKKEVYHERVS